MAAAAMKASESTRTPSMSKMIPESVPAGFTGPSVSELIERCPRPRIGSKLRLPRQHRTFVPLRMGGTPIGTGALPAVPYLRGSALSDLSGDRHGRGREPGDGDRLESFLPIHGNDVWLHA